MIRALLGKYKIHFKVAVAAVVIVLLVGSCYYIQYLSEENDKLSNKLTIRDIKITSLESNIALLELSRDNDQRASQLIAKSYSDLREDNQRLNDELSEYKGRHSTIVKKPSLVERRINLATDRLFDSLECESGGKCKSGKGLSSTPP